MIKKLLSLALAMVAITAVHSQNLWDIISTSPDHTQLTLALEAAGLDAVLDTDEAVTFTVWAPTDAAFAQIPQAELDALLAEPDGFLTAILLYHVLPNTVLAADLADGQVWPTLLEIDVEITIDGASVLVNEATVVNPFDVQGQFGGVVHSIDQVLIPILPCTSFFAPDFESMPDAPVKVDGVCNAVQTPFAVWPNELYGSAGYVAGVEYVASICNGEGAGSWDAELVVFSEEGDLITSTFGCEINFTVPADGTYLIGISEDGFCGEQTGNAQVENGVLVVTCISDPIETSVWDLIQGSAQHTILTQAIEAAGLVTALDEPGTFTVFAPTDAAFNALPAGLLDDLLADPTGFLTDILLYHVLGSTVLSTELSDGQIVTTLNGQAVTITIEGTNAFVNESGIIEVDVAADNGVVHFIDAVLVPQDICFEFSSIVGNFNTQFGGAPEDVDGVCEVHTLSFGVWPGELYPVDNFVEGVEYNFSICEGPGAGAWPTEITVFTTEGLIVEFVEGCEVTFISPINGTMLIGINEVGFCGNSENEEVDNGIPTLTCTGSLSATSEVIEGNVLVFPNPTSNQFTVSMELTQASTVTIDLVNLLGQPVKSLDLNTRSAGATIETIDVSDLANGFYMMNITVGESQSVTKVQVMH